MLHSGSNSFSSTPSPSSFYRRPSIASSSSWEPGLSSYSSEMSLQSPSTPQTEEGTSPGDLFIPDTHNLFNGMNSDMPSMQDFSSPFAFGSERQDYFPPKDFSMSQPMTQNQLAAFEDMALPPLQENNANALGSLYELPSYRLDGSHACYDLSSPMGDWSSSPVSASTVVPSQTVAGPVTPRLGGAASLALSKQGSSKSASATDSIAYYPFTTPTPSPSVSPAGEARDHWTRPNPAQLTSDMSTPSRRPARAKARNSVPKKWEPRFIYPRTRRNTSVGTLGAEVPFSGRNTSNATRLATRVTGRTNVAWPGANSKGPAATTSSST